MVQIALTLVEAVVLLGFSIGLLWGESFSGFDGKIKYETEWFKGLDDFGQWLVGSILDSTHHFQYGLSLYVFSYIYDPIAPPMHPLRSLFVQCLAWGLIVSDWKDYKNVLKRFTSASMDGGEDAAP